MNKWKVYFNKFYNKARKEGKKGHPQLSISLDPSLLSQNNLPEVNQLRVSHSLDSSEPPEPSQGNCSLLKSFIAQECNLVEDVIPESSSGTQANHTDSIDTSFIHPSTGDEDDSKVGNNQSNNPIFDQTTNESNELHIKLDENENIINCTEVNKNRKENLPGAISTSGTVPTPGIISTSDAPQYLIMSPVKQHLAGKFTSTLASTNTSVGFEPSLVIPAHQQTCFNRKDGYIYLNTCSSGKVHNTTTTNNNNNNNNNGNNNNNNNINKNKNKNNGNNNNNNNVITNNNSRCNSLNNNNCATSPSSTPTNTNGNPPTNNSATNNTATNNTATNNIATNNTATNNTATNNTNIPVNNTTLNESHSNSPCMEPNMRTSHSNVSFNGSLLDSVPPTPLHCHAKITKQDLPPPPLPMKNKSNLLNSSNQPISRGSLKVIGSNKYTHHLMQQHIHRRSFNYQQHSRHHQTLPDNLNPDRPPERCAFNRSTEDTKDEVEDEYVDCNNHQVFDEIDSDSNDRLENVENYRYENINGSSLANKPRNGLSVYYNCLQDDIESSEYFKNNHQNIDNNCISSNINNNNNMNSRNSTSSNNSSNYSNINSNLSTKSNCNNSDEFKHLLQKSVPVPKFSRSSKQHSYANDSQRPNSAHKPPPPLLKASTIDGSGHCHSHENITSSSPPIPSRRIQTAKHFVHGHSSQQRPTLTPRVLKYKDVEDDSNRISDHLSNRISDKVSDRFSDLYSCEYFVNSKDKISYLQLDLNPSIKDHPPIPTGNYGDGCDVISMHRSKQEIALNYKEIDWLKTMALLETRKNRTQVCSDITIS